MKSHGSSLRLFMKNSMVSFVMVLLLGILNYILVRTLVKELPQSDFGFYKSMIAMIMLLLTFLDLGLGEAMAILISRSYSLGDSARTRRLFTSFLYFRIVLAIACFGALAIASFWLKAEFFDYPGPFYYLLCLFSLVISLSLESAMIQSCVAIQAFKMKYILHNTKTLLLCLISMLLVPKYGLAAICIAWPIVSLLTAGVGACYLRHKNIASLSIFRHEHFIELKAVLAISLWIAIARAGTSMMYYMDTLCLTWLRESTDVAVYGVASSLNHIAYSLMVLPILLTPTVSIMWAEKDYKKIKRITFYIICFCLAMFPVALLVGVFWAKDIISVLFPEKAEQYVGGATALAWLWAGMIFFAIGNVCTRTLNAGHAHRSVAGMVIFCVIVNLILNILLIPNHGPSGAAAATASTYVLLAISSTTILFIRLKSLQNPNGKDNQD